MRAKRIICTVTSDPNFDQRMIRICTSLQHAGYEVLLLGRRKPGDRPLIPRPFRQVRLLQRINRGKLFYATYNLKLFFYLLCSRADAFCAIDLDTILPVYYASMIRRKKRVYDAHELFCEIEEVVSNPPVQKMWKLIERHTVPHFRFGYTVNQSIADEFKNLYGVDYAVVRNITVLRDFSIPESKPERYILYQGAVNKGRCFEQLIPAMRDVPCRLVICGEGNFLEQAKALTREHGLEQKIEFKGYIAPEDLKAYTEQATIGITLFVATSRSNELSLANRFFDYMHSAVPQLAMAYPEYQHINHQFEVASLISDTRPESIAAALNRLLDDDAYYKRLQANCLQARKQYCWQREEHTLITVYQNLFA